MQKERNLQLKVILVQQNFLKLIAKPHRENVTFMSQTSLMIGNNNNYLIYSSLSVNSKEPMFILTIGVKLALKFATRNQMMLQKRNRI